MKTRVISAYYGRVPYRHDCEVYVCDEACGLSWYIVDGGTVVNATYDDITDGMDIDELNDEACFTWNEPIFSEEELLTAVNS